ncbi:MAG TPA: hypothetical protein VH372_04000 [Actinospica sp.]|jgi:hypothetical protein|nr:hypothetical protein [Actinospica sp.]
MTSINPNDSAASTSMAGLDPVHPDRPPRTAVATEATGPAAKTEPIRPAPAPAAPAAQAERVQHGAEPERRLACGCGTPATLDHRVVALETRGGDRPLVVHMADADLALMPLEAQVWARAGRLTVVAHDGSELKFTVLSTDECADLYLGERWPAGESQSRTRRMAVAAARDVGDVLTFPAWLARTTRLSGQRNATLHGLVKRLREASPGTAVFYGQTFGFEHHRPEHQHPYDHRGIVGREGYPGEL